MTLPSFPPRTEKKLTALAFDYGVSHIGTAYGQSFTGTAQALEILKARDGVPDWDAVARLIDTWQPDVLVVGMPYHLDGSDSAMIASTERFAGRLHGRFHLPCYGMDERLSSRAAADLVDDPETTRIDSIAARLILESWFGELRNRQSAAP